MILSCEGMLFTTLLVGVLQDFVQI